MLDLFSCCWQGREAILFPFQCRLYWHLLRQSLFTILTSRWWWWWWRRRRGSSLRLCQCLSRNLRQLCSAPRITEHCTQSTIGHSRAEGLLGSEPQRLDVTLLITRQHLLQPAICDSLGKCLPGLLAQSLDAVVRLCRRRCFFPVLVLLLFQHLGGKAGFQHLLQGARFDRLGQCVTSMATKHVDLMAAWLLQHHFAYFPRCTARKDLLEFSTLHSFTQGTLSLLPQVFDWNIPG
mmetsp:Transcript_70981/g.148483  ORF Transcript_70981/g.148483 Transcript_70981/m.148483 type:complete len:235 (+) Transcript_70981:1179-1883(+)